MPADPGSPTPSAADAIGFAQPLQAEVPIAFLPLRLETRFGTDATGKPQLWIRAYPDDIHVDSFEPELTAAERMARDAFLADPAANGPDADKRLAAWAGLARRFGTRRAAWIVSAQAANTGTKAADWTRAASTALLPDRLIFTAYDAEGGIVRQAGAEIADGLPLGPSPAGGDPATDEGLRWMRDFQHAIDLGLGIRLPISAAQQANGFTRVLVFGVKSKLPPAKGAEQFAHAIDAHHYTDGVELLPHGTPTNNSEGVKAGYRSDDPGYALSFTIERGPPRTPSTDGTADGDRLAAALGISSGHFALVQGSDGRHDAAPAAMNAVLWPATLGYYLQNLVNGAVPDADNVIAAGRDHFVGWTRGRGPWPTLRIGHQPYGILPVVSSRSYQPIEGGPLLGRLFALLQKLRPHWRSSAGHVVRVAPGIDPDVTLASILGLAPCSTDYAGRTVLGPQFNGFYWRFVGKNVDSSWFTRLSEMSTSLLGTDAPIMAATRLGNATYLGKHFPLASALVADPLGDSPLDDNYLSAFAGMTWGQLRDATPAVTPVALFWLLVRHAALRQYVDSAYSLLGPAIPPDERLEPELVNISPTVVTRRIWDQLALSTAATGAVGTWLDQHKLDGPAPFAQFWRALSVLATTKTRDLDAALRETIDLCTYRLDAWFTSLATLRLDSVRKRGGNQQTLYIGAYGWLENVRPQGDVATWGYIHAPSVSHAATAAVLRSGYLSHQSAGSGTAAIDLSSRRVRRAQQLLEGVRAGQPLGAQLGYQFERALHEHGRDVYIARFRTMVQTGEVAGDPVVDGLALLDKKADLKWNGTKFPAAGTQDYDTLNTLLSDLADTLDAVSDLMLAESVHQLVGGNPLRAGATVDALGRGDSPPPEIDVTRTPRRGGVITHRLLACLPEGPATDWPQTARSHAEPRINALVAQLLGPANRVRVQAEFRDTAGALLSTIEITLANTTLGPLDLLVLNDRPLGLQGQSEIEQRLARAAWLRRPPGVPVNAQMKLVLARNALWPPEVLSLDELLAAAYSVRALLAGVRGATAVDLATPDQVVDLAIDVAELQGRADAAAAALTSARAQLDTAGPDSALEMAAQFGVEGAVPAIDAQAWPQQVALVKPLLDARLAQLAALDNGVVRTGASAAELRDHDIARLRIVFGSSLPVIARFDETAAATLPTLFSRSAMLLADRPGEARTYLSRAARVRQAVGRFDEAFLCAESFGSDANLDLAVAQLPAVAGEKWVGLPLASGAKAVDRLSILAVGPSASAKAAIYIDEWLEAVPNAIETTGLAFHVDDAKSRAPQAILLGIQPDSRPQWTLDSVEGTLLEALELAQLRAVDPDTLGVVGHFLPALFFAANFGSAPADTISTDLTLAAPPPRTRPVTSVPIVGGMLGRL